MYHLCTHDTTGATEALLERAQLEREKADALKAGGGAVAKSGAAWRDEPVSTSKLVCFLN
jgi:hypothetical protein